MRIEDVIKILEVIDYSNKIKKSRSDLILDINLMWNALKQYRCIFLKQKNSYYWLVCFLTSFLSGKEVYLFDEEISIKSYALQIKPDLIIDSNEFYQTFNKGKLEKCYFQHNIGAGKIVLYTTGSMHESQGILFDEKNFFEPIKYQIKGLQISGQDNIVILSSFAHAYGISAVMSALQGAKTIYIVDNSFDFLRIVFENKDVNCAFIPPVLLPILKQNKEYIEQLKHYKFLGVGGAKVNKRLVDYFVQAGINIINLYGSTETGMCYIGVSKPGDDFDKLYLSECMERKVANDGELMVRGRNIGKSINLGKEIVDSDGWYHTGDIIEDKGSYFIISGRKDLIVAMNNGYKINVEKIENKIKELSGIEECLIKIENINSVECIVLYIEERDKGKIEKNSINRNLKYYEKISIIRYIPKIKMKRGKKMR